MNDCSGECNNYPDRDFAYDEDYMYSAEVNEDYVYSSDNLNSYQDKRNKLSSVQNKKSRGGVQGFYQLLNIKVKPNKPD